MDYLSDTALQEAYKHAMELNLDHAFIEMIETELLKRTKDFRHCEYFTSKEMTVTF